MELIKKIYTIGTKAVGGSELTKGNWKSFYIENLSRVFVILCCTQR